MIGSPLHVVPKANTTELRLGGDYKAWNKMLTPDRYPLPHLRTAYELLHGSNIFSTVDLKSAFHHVPIAPESVHKTTIRTPVGDYAFTRTPFGLSTSAQVFQRLIDTVIRGLPFLYAYVDDILIFIKDEKEHLEHLSSFSIGKQLWLDNKPKKMQVWQEGNSVLGACHNTKRNFSCN